MANELIPVEAQSTSLATYEDVVSSNQAWLPRVNLMTSASEICKSGAFPINHFALISGKDHTDLGSEVDVVVCAWRPKALRTGGDVLINSHDPDSEEYKAIIADSGTKDSGCLHGPEYLLWLPERDCFATMLWGSISARMESRSIHGLLNCAATLKPKRVEGKKNTWYIPTADECNTITATPDLVVLDAEINKFLHPPVVEVPEKDTEATRER